VDEDEEEEEERREELVEEIQGVFILLGLRSRSLTFVNIHLSAKITAKRHWMAWCCFGQTQGFAGEANAANLRGWETVLVLTTLD
jgi:hypothetical protein